MRVPIFPILMLGRLLDLSVGVLLNLGVVPVLCSLLFRMGGEEKTRA